MGFCVPYAYPVGVTPDGGIVIQPGYVCWGGEVPAPDLPDFAPPVPGADLPEVGSDLAGGDVEAQSEADTEEDVCTEGCDDCRAVSQGTWAWTNYAPDEAEYHYESTWQGYRYQAAVCGTAHNPPGGKIMEYKFVAYSWDGFRSGACTMLEAKWGYDGLLESFYEMESGDPRRQTRAKDPRAKTRFIRLISQATKQKARLSPYEEVKLHWMFSNFDSYIFFRSVGGNGLMVDGKMTIEHRQGPTG